ncbi:uncharacterized protein LOC131018542 [Salvia miltiorrhiza]|uniref:uncharacterized protein LOC131018542 n=1 Tax=Salvia miltiorrhiza TaxID=226208 RepID=UPI0025AD8717|nr:uncharacterized protein LOC131018542 [Salvia miltiorrhiza]
MLANGGVADQYDEYLRITESISLECLRRFCRAIIQLFGFLGMLGSLDCMHWLWNNCPTAWQGAYTRSDQGEPTIILEAVASQDLWIWHAFFGTPSSNNDINSPTNPTDPNGKRFKVLQEATCKDIEQAFGILQARWAIVKGPSRLWSKEEMSDIMFTCIILHNMMIEDEGEHATQWEEDADEASSSAASQPHAGASPDFRAFVARQASMRDAEMPARLTLDLKEHIWSRFGLIEP